MKKNLITILLIFIGFYLGFSFIELDFVFWKWSKEVRAGFFSLTFPSYFLLYALKI